MITVYWIDGHGVEHSETMQDVATSISFANEEDR